MTKQDDSFFAKPATVEVKDVDDDEVAWGHDASLIQKQAGLGSYGPDPDVGEPPLASGVAEQALAAMEDQSALRARYRRDIFLVDLTLAVLCVSNVLLWLKLLGVFG